MSKLKIVSMVRINREKVRQEDVPPEEFRAIVEQGIVRAMSNIGFERVDNENNNREVNNECKNQNFI